MLISGSFIQIKENQERLLKAKDFLPPVVRLFTSLSVKLHSLHVNFVIMINTSQCEKGNLQVHVTYFHYDLK